MEWIDIIDWFLETEADIFILSLNVLHFRGYWLSLISHSIYLFKRQIRLTCPGEFLSENLGQKFSAQRGRKPRGFCSVKISRGLRKRPLQGIHGLPLPFLPLLFPFFFLFLTVGRFFAANERGNGGENGPWGSQQCFRNANCQVSILERLFFEGITHSIKENRNGVDRWINSLQVFGKYLSSFKSSKIVSRKGNFIWNIVLGKGNWPGNLFDSRWSGKSDGKVAVRINFWFEGIIYFFNYSNGIRYILT